MNAGLPGTGLGGLFYLLAALWMPFHELVRTLLGRRSETRWVSILVQSALALAMGVAAWGTYWLVAFVFFVLPETERGLKSYLSARGSVTDFLPVAPVLLTITALVTVLLLLEAVRLVLRRPLPSRG